MHRAERARRPSAGASRSSRGGAATPSCRPGRCSPTGRAAGPTATAAARRACRAGRRRSWPAARRTLRRSGRRTTAARRLPSNARARARCACAATSSGCASPYHGWSIGNHITSCGLTSATVRNHGWSSVAALARSHDAAFDAMIGSKCTPVPAQPMKWRSLPSQSAKPYAVMSGDGDCEQCHLPM